MLFQFIFIMKVKLIVIFSLALFLLFGCIGSDNMTNSNNTNLNDTNQINESNTNNTYNNLDQFRKVKVGDNISVHYVGKVEGGAIFDSSIGKEPLTFDAGTGQMIKGFDNAVIGMKVGDTKTITLPPEEAYGNLNEENKQVILKEQLPDMNFEVGQEVIIGQYRLKIYEVNDNNVLASVNHFLGGKTLIFELQLVSINN